MHNVMAWLAYLEDNIAKRQKPHAQPRKDGDTCYVRTQTAPPGFLRYQCWVGPRACWPLWRPARDSVLCCLTSYSAFMSSTSAAPQGHVGRPWQRPRQRPTWAPRHRHPPSSHPIPSRIPTASSAFRNASVQATLRPSGARLHRALGSVGALVVQHVLRQPPLRRTPDALANTAPAQLNPCLPLPVLHPLVRFARALSCWVPP